LSAALGLVIVFADTKNAYQQLPPPTDLHATFRLMMPTSLSIVNNFVVMLIHASILFKCTGLFKVTLKLVCYGRK
jgi:hypothetical protein